MVLISSFILTIFVIVAMIHLVHSYQGKLGQADITKFFLMPLLIAFYLVASLFQTFGLVNVLILCALVLFWVGDMLLIYDWQRSSFYFGIFTFMIAQFLLVIVGFIFFQKLNFPIISGLLLLAVYLCILVVKIVFLRRPFAFIGLKICTIFYLISTTLVSYVFLVLAIANSNIYTILMAIAGIFFMFSDYHVIQEYYIGGNKLSRFIIMFGYLVGITLMVVSCVYLKPLLIS